MQRPLVTELRPESRAPHVVIMGGGYAGTATAIKLQDAGTTPLRITLIEPRAELGRGVAYSTRESGHLMNGPAKLFSLHPERPEHFSQYLARFAGEWGWRDPMAPDFSNAFAPRSVFGDYVRGELARAVARAAPGTSLQHVATEALDLRRRSGRLDVILANGYNLVADHVVLAVGAGRRRDLPAHPETVGRYIADPWDLEAFEGLPRDGRVLLIGAGLTMLDALVTLERRGFRGNYLAISRRGLLVQPRREVLALRDFLAEAPLPVTASALLRVARRELARPSISRPDWQSLVMAIRPHVPALWQRASAEERARFLRHLRPIWEISLHRAPPRSAQLLERGRAEGWFRHRAGRIAALTASQGRIAASIRFRGQPESETALFDAVIDCRGATYDWTRSTSTLAANLLASGTVRPGPLCFGIDADTTSAVIGRDGLAASDISAIGPALRGVRWESATLVELLQQAVQLAARISALTPGAEQARLGVAGVG